MLVVRFYNIVWRKPKQEDYVYYSGELNYQGWQRDLEIYHQLPKERIFIEQNEEHDKLFNEQVAVEYLNELYSWYGVESFDVEWVN